MFHVDNNTGVSVMPPMSPLYSALRLFFTEGGNGVSPTYPGPDWFNTVQSELLYILDMAGINAAKADTTQLLTALRKLLLSRDNPFGDIKADGSAAIATALANLGLKEAAKLGVATSSQMATGTATDLLPSVAAVMSLFSKRSFSSNDYIRIPDVPGGLMFQWATIMSGSGGDAAWIYPTPFPNARMGAWGIFHRLGVAGTDYPTISFNNVSDPTPKTLSNFHLRANGQAGSYSAFVFAIGY